MLAADTVQIWFTFAIIGLAVVSYVSERISMELTSVLVIVALLAFFEFHPLALDGTANALNAPSLLAGFANPALVTIIALLVIGQGLYHTAALERPTRQLAFWARRRPLLTLGSTLIGAGFLSAFLNNTPVVVMFIPVLSSLAARLNVSPAKLLIPLSFISILGGMTTVIGSSTNLLVAGMVEQVGLMKLGFFDFAVPGFLLATVGAVYVGLCVPRLLPERDPLASAATGLSGKQFIAQLAITPDHPLHGAEPIAGLFPALKNMTVRLVQRGDTSILPPFEEVSLRSGDMVIVAATRQALTEALLAGEGLLTTDVPISDDDQPSALDGSGAELTLCETVVAPSSTLIGRRIGQSGLRADTGCLVLGIQRRSRMIRGRLEDIRLEPGDGVLLLGPRGRIRDLRTNRDLLLLEWSAHELPDIKLANRARLIFAATVGLAAAGVLPIVIAALAGAAAMIPAGCLNMRQAARAVDRRIFLLIGAAIAMALALEKTGAGQLIAHTVIAGVGAGSPALVLSVLFLLIAVMTNFLSNNATALLFTPIAASTALELGVDAKPFIFAVIFAANCSFATPMGYQTNLLVMGPGQYRYLDYTRSGAPLIVLLWLSYSIFAPWYYGL